MNRIIAWTGSTMTTVCAAVETFFHEGTRLWLLAIVSVGISIWGTWRSRRKVEAEERAAIARERTEKYVAQRERMQLCAACQRCGRAPASCVVPPQHRPGDCPLK